MQDIRKDTEILLGLIYETVPKNASNCNVTFPENYMKERKCGIIIAPDALLSVLSTVSMHEGFLPAGVSMQSKIQIIHPLSCR